MKKNAGYCPHSNTNNTELEFYYAQAYQNKHCVNDWNSFTSIDVDTFHANLIQFNFQYSIFIIFKVIKRNSVSTFSETFFIFN